jgi:hypothetical protein
VASVSVTNTDESALFVEDAAVSAVIIIKELRFVNG